MGSIEQIKASDGTGNANVATVESSRAPGASTINVDTVLGINPAGFAGTMGTPHTFTDPITSETITVISEATAVDFTGHVDGTNLEIDDIADGYVDGGSEIGDIVIIRPTTQWGDNLAEVLEESLNDDGTLKSSIVVNAKIADGATTPAKLLAGTGTSWAWQSWTPTLTNATVGNGTLACKYIQIGKTVYFRFAFTLGSTSAVSSQPTFSLPVTAVSYPLTAGTTPSIGQGQIFDSALAVYPIVALFASTTTAVMQAFSAGGAYVSNVSITNTVPFTWATGDEFWIEGFYEAP